MSWNYRIFKRKYDNETMYELHETFYDDEGKLDSWSKEPEYGPYESVDELIDDLDLMLDDAKRYCVLDYDKEENEDNNP